MQRELTFESGGSKLFGTLCQAPEERAAILLIAGGANKPRQQSYYPPLQREILKHGITSLSFDFRGVGDSEGNIAETNLLTRVEDARAALNLLKEHSQSEEIYILGTSMGGSVGIQILDSNVKGVILAVPAAYSQYARDKNFGPDFSTAIRKPESWLNSPDFEDLAKYKGEMCLVYGTADEVIPQQIFATYEEIVHSTEGIVIVLEGAPHFFWNTGAGSHASAEIAEFMLRG